MEDEEKKSLTESIKNLTKLVDQLRSKRYLQFVESPVKFLLYNFFSGLASGLGTAIGATIIFGLIILLLSKLQIVPIVGNWAVTILDYIHKARGGI